jgi:cytochrome b6-f complex iron-sulfur subunit
LGLLAAGQAGLLAGCSLLDDAELQAGTVAELDAKGFLQVEFNGDIVRVVRRADGSLLALDLTCTHKQCTVEYKPERAEYVCPCHKGRYNSEGRVLAGKPPAPLRRLRAEMRKGQVWLLNETVS